jgi:hypothetical protein
MSYTHMRMYERAIIIDEPWLSKIVTGRKGLEMRSRRTNITGPIALIRRRSGAIVGVAELLGSLPPLSYNEFSSQECRHRIPRASVFGRGELQSLRGVSGFE